MTARMRAPKPTARERLLSSIEAALRARCATEYGGEHCTSCTAYMNTARRLLRAHERDLAERAGREAYGEVMAAAKNDLATCEIAECAMAGVRSCILGPQRRGKR